MIRRPRRSPLFPYTTLFRSAARHPDGVDVPVDPFDLEPFAAREPAAPMELPLRSGGRDGASQQREGGEGDGAHGQRRSEEHTSELQSQSNLVCRLLLEKKKPKPEQHHLVLRGATVTCPDCKTKSWVPT